jgi:hypothetical protein
MSPIVIVCVLQTVLHGGTALAKLTPMAREKMADLRPPLPIRALAGLQLAGVLGTWLGLEQAGIGLAASTAFVVYLALAIERVWRFRRRVDIAGVVGIILAVTATVMFGSRL